MRPVDSHCHLQFEEFDSDRKKIIEEVEENLEFAVLAGINPKDNLEAKEISETSDSLKYCMGLHPLHHESEIQKVEEQIEEEEPIAVGEIGLDYNYITDSDEREESEKVFREMLAIAEEKGLPVVVHSRNAERKCFEIVEEFNVRGFFHCFNGRPKLAEEIVSSGHLIGVTNQITYSSRVKKIVERIDLEDILAETDSPYLHEERNRPVNVAEVIEEIADIKSVDVSKVLETTSKNSRDFFM